MPVISRGFRGRGSGGPSNRIPPGQHEVHDFPVLSAGPTPHTPLAEWTFTIEGGPAPITWSWEEFRALPSEEITVDDRGYADGPVTIASSGATPYGFDFTHGGALVVTEAFGG